MKNFIIILLGVLLLLSLLGYAYVTYDNAEDEIISDDYTYGMDTQESAESHTESTENESASDVTTDEKDDQEKYDFTVEDINGDLIKRSEITGKPMVVHFWASWCDYCTYELPALQASYEKYGDQIEFMIVCITDGEYETVESAKKYLSDKGYTFPVYFDVNSEALHNYQLYNLSEVPRTYLFDAEGNYKLKAQKAVTEDILEEGITILLEEKE